jgi:hypothetical protein
MGAAITENLSEGRMAGSVVTLLSITTILGATSENSEGIQRRMLGIAQIARAAP